MNLERRGWRAAEQSEYEAGVHPEQARLTRDQERSLWLHRAVLAELVAEAEEVLARVRGICIGCERSTRTGV